MRPGQIDCAPGVTETASERYEQAL